MIVYLNKNNETFDVVSSQESDYQVIISRLKSNTMSINKKVNDSYKNISLISKEAKDIKEFILEHFKNVIKEIDNQLVEM